MKKLISLILTIVLLNNTIVCLNDTYADTVFLDKGTPAPYSGYLFDPVKEKQLHLTDLNLNYYKSLSESLTVINKAQSDNLSTFQERIDNRDKQIDLLSKRVQENDSGFLSKATYFIFGAIVTGLIAQSIYRTK